METKHIIEEKRRIEVKKMCGDIKKKKNKFVHLKIEIIVGSRKPKLFILKRRKCHIPLRTRKRRDSQLWTLAEVECFQNPEI